MSWRGRDAVLANSSSMLLVLDAKPVGGMCPSSLFYYLFIADRIIYISNGNLETVPQLRKGLLQHHSLIVKTVSKISKEI